MNWSVAYSPRPDAKLTSRPATFQSVRESLVKQLERKGMIILTPEQAKLLLSIWS